MTWNRTRCCSCLGKGRTFKINNCYDAVYHRLVCDDGLKKTIVFNLSDPILNDVDFNIDQVLDLVNTIKSVSHIIRVGSCDHNNICNTCYGKGYIDE